MKPLRIDVSALQKIFAYLLCIIISLFSMVAIAKTGFSIYNALIALLSVALIMGVVRDILLAYRVVALGYCLMATMLVVKLFSPYDANPYLRLDSIFRLSASLISASVLLTIAEVCDRRYRYRACSKASTPAT